MRRQDYILAITRQQIETPLKQLDCNQYLFTVIILSLETLKRIDPTLCDFMIITNPLITTIKTKTVHRKPQTLTMKTLTCDTVSFTKKTQSSISFKGNKELTRAISNQLFLTDFDIKAIVNKYKPDNRVLGDLPSSLLEKIPESKKQKAEKEIETALGKASRLLNTAVFKLDKDILEYSNEQLTSIFNTELTIGKNLIAETLLKNNVINDVEDIELSILGKGSYGTGYKLKINNQNYCFKVFHNIDNDAFSDDLHGRYIENNRAAFIHKYASGNQFVNFHLGDPYNGFMMTDYLDEKSPRTINRITESLYGFSYEDDSSDNTIAGRFTDFGYITISNKTLASNKTAHNIYKEIYGSTVPRFRPKVWNEIFEQKGNSEDTNIGLALCIDTFGSLTEQIKYFEKIMTLPDNSKAKITAMDTLPQTIDIEGYFEAIAKTVDNESKPALIVFLRHLPEDKALKWFNEFNKDPDVDTKIALSKHVHSLTKDEKLAFYDECKQMAADSPKMQHLLVDITNQLPLEARLDHFNSIAKHANDTIIALMINRLFNLSEESEKQTFLKSHLNNPSIEVKKSLLFKLNNLPIPERFTACKTILNGANDAVKMLIIDEIKSLPVDQKKDLMSLIAQNASPTVLDYIDMNS